MFGLEYVMGFISVMIRLGMAIVWAIPVNFIWGRLGGIYFDFLPDLWLNIPFWHIVGMCILIDFIGLNIKALVPSLVNIDNSAKAEK